MSARRPDGLAREIVARAKAAGADLVGIAAVDDLKRSPSHRIVAHLPDFDGVGTQPATGPRRGIVRWPDKARSAVVLALAHPAEQPALDWWISRSAGGNTAGNQKLIALVDGLADWLTSRRGVQCHRLPYHIESGAVYMKDAAVLAGLGCIGKNNLLTNPRYGPRLRLRVMLIDTPLPSSGPLAFDPCGGCAAPCRPVCPSRAFDHRVYSPPVFEHDPLPGRNGVYDRFACNRQMVDDERHGETLTVNGAVTARRVAYCRACELACPVGRP